MVNLEVKLETLKKDYPGFYELFKDTLERSQSRFKSYKENKFKCYYYVGFYMKPSNKNEEYYENLYKMKWDERLKEEFSKIRVTITMVAGKFAISDQTKELNDTVNPLIKEIVSRKMYFEQRYFNFENEDVVDSIPDFENLKDKIESEIEAQKDFIEAVFDDSTTNSISREKELKPQDRLNKLISEEKYEEAEELINNHPELKKRGDK